MSEGRLPGDHGSGGLLSAWVKLPENDALNTAVCRGAPVGAGGYAFAWAGVASDGSFRMPVGWERCALCLQREEVPPEWFLPQATPHGFVLESLPRGSVAGRVTGLPAAVSGHTWVVLFGRGILRLTARVSLDGTFTFPAVPAGTFFLRAGDDEFGRVREPLRAVLGLDDQMSLARPSVGAVAVEVRAGETTGGVEVPFDPPQAEAT